MKRLFDSWQVQVIWLVVRVAIALYLLSVAFDGMTVASTGLFLLSTFVAWAVLIYILSTIHTFVKKQGWVS
jgi:hypothetical protein